MEKDRKVESEAKTTYPGAKSEAQRPQDRRRDPCQRLWRKKMQKIENRNQSKDDVYRSDLTLLVVTKIEQRKKAEKRKDDIPRSEVRSPGATRSA